MLCNVVKNRYPDVLPCTILVALKIQKSLDDENRVILNSPGTPGNEDYINASFIDSQFGDKRQYIATQGIN